MPDLSLSRILLEILEAEDTTRRVVHLQWATHETRRPVLLGKKAIVEVAPTREVVSGSGRSAQK